MLARDPDGVFLSNGPGDPEVAGDPEHLIVYGGRGRAARNWPAFEAILESLRDLEPDETLLVQSGTAMLAQANASSQVAALHTGSALRPSSRLSRIRGVLIRRGCFT